MKVTLTESQVNRLIGGYKQLNEQGDGFNQNTVTKSIDLGATFDSGKYILDSAKQTDVEKRLQPLVKFLKTNPSSDVKITIVAGESRVTNYDREKCGAGIYTPECKLKPKQLSLLRAQQIEQYLSKLFQGLKSDGTIQKLPPKPVISTVLGSTSYTAGTDDPNDPKYKKEQKIELLIDAEASYECLVGMNLTISYEGKGGHTCDEAIFDVQLNNVSLGVANLNNGNKDVADRGVGKKRSSLIIKNKVNIYNYTLSKQLVSKVSAVRREIRLYGPKTNPKSTKNGLMLKDYEINGQTLESLGYPQNSFNDIVKAGKNEAFMKMIKDQVAIANGGINYSKETIVDELIVKKMGTVYKFQPSDIGKPITDIMTQGVAIQEKLWNIEGRETDNKPGGIRRQVFTLDQSRAKSIVDGGKIKDRLILSITPLVGKSGPYKVFYKNGSHSDVPTVKITNGDGETLYSGNPNVKMTRGSMSKTALLQTDLCGKPLKS
jgi:hypothetical protein